MEKLKLMFQFLQEQILGMKWMNEIIGKGLSVLGVDISRKSRRKHSVFLYDVIKITIYYACLFYHILYSKAIFHRREVKRY